MAVDPGDVDALSELLDLFQYIQPTNSDAERERFMAAVSDGEQYNPSYQYREVDCGEAKDLLTSLREDTTTELEQRMLRSLGGRLNMIEAIGSEDITAASREHYGSPGDDLIAEARARFSPGTSGGEQTIDGSRLKEGFDQLFEELGVAYESEPSDVDIIRNSPRDRRILIPDGKRYTARAAKRLLVHESTHSIRTVNGLKDGRPPLVHGTLGYEIVEEGLATFNEDALGVFQDTLPRITARVVAVGAATEPFHDLYTLMRDLGLDERTAFIRTYRIKRGLRDTAQPGGFIKDHIYYQGYTRLSAEPETDDRLYAGKIGFQDLETVDSTPHITREEHLDACRRATETIAP